MYSPISFFLILIAHCVCSIPCPQCQMYRYLKNEPTVFDYGRNSLNHQPIAQQFSSFGNPKPLNFDPSAFGSAIGKTIAEQIQQAAHEKRPAVKFHSHFKKIFVFGWYLSFIFPLDRVFIVFSFSIATTNFSIFFSLSYLIPTNSANILEPSFNPFVVSDTTTRGSSDYSTNNEANSKLSSLSDSEFAEANRIQFISWIIAAAITKSNRI
ncbi:unnamed protein product [Caenorhabditis bovis]|uniref:Uncharacterized protein n=1 Tax=Caenorhabditis bovis TaxID=2654633 RepID=A0A8S1F5N3_9PELO|nr:unnamed protein product [Caenorhabditis bovis]